MKENIIKKITILGNEYKILCHKDERDRLDILVKKIDERATKVAKKMEHKTCDALMFLLIALDLEDRVEGLERECKELRDGHASKEEIINPIVYAIENFMKKIENGSY